MFIQSDKVETVQDIRYTRNNLDKLENDLVSLIRLFQIFVSSKRGNETICPRFP